MAYRFTNTEKWADAWFCNLSQIQMLLFLYMCDNCDIAGFIEINYKRWTADLGSSKETIEGALKGLERGLIVSESNDCIFIKNFLKHQKNYPLNENNKAHIGIIRRFDLYKEKFKIESIDEFIKAPSKGLQSPSGNGIGIGNILNWKNDFQIYLSECKKGFANCINDSKFIATQEKLNPGVNIQLTMEKSFTNYWGTEAGWKNKKQAKIKEIDWNRTIVNAITQKMNIVYKSKN